MNQNLVDFYRGAGADAAGRTIADVWKFDHAHLEDVHDYIQWLFPLAKASQYNANAPLLDDETIAAFTGDPALQSKLEKSLLLMLDFYGLQLVPAAGTIIIIKKASHYAARQSNWQDAPSGSINHNLLRLTRMLESLRLLGMCRESLALWRCLEDLQKEVPSKIPDKTVGFWKQAAGQV